MITPRKGVGLDYAKFISDGIYVNMASVSVYRSSGNYVLDTKTLTLPCVLLPLSSATIMIIVLIRGLIQLAR